MVALIFPAPLAASHLLRNAAPVPARESTARTGTDATSTFTTVWALL